ncbi:retrotransposon protein, putative, ty1-copia subclass [Tanacetum coccineum]
MVDSRFSRLQLCSLLQKLGKTLAMSCRGLKSTEIFYQLLIAPVAIIDRQLPFEYTIASRSTDVMVMAQPVQNINHLAFRSMFEREKLSDSTAQVLADWNAVYDAHNEFACLMLGSMTPELRRQFENSSPYEMLQELKLMFEKQAGVERIDDDGVLDLISLDMSLTSDFAGFVRNYNMHNMGKTIGELHALLIEYEKSLPKKAATPQVMAIQGGRIQKSNKKSKNAKGKGKGNGKGKDKQGYILKPKNLIPSAKEHPVKDDACHHCKEVGHYKRNCPAYLAELIKKNKQVRTANSLGLRGERKLKQGALYLYVGNSVHAQVEAVGSFDLILANGLVICLDNCHYAPTITRGVVLVSRLVDNDFIQCFTDYGILVSKNDVLYLNVIPRDGIYEIDMLNLVPKC